MKGKRPHLPKQTASKSARPNSGASDLQRNTNRFIILSNVEGDSNVSEEELASTTALVLGNTVANATYSGMMASTILSSVHPVENIPEVANSSASVITKPASTGIVIKEKDNIHRS